MKVQRIAGVFAGILCISQPLQANDDSLLIGKWKLITFTDRLPGACASGSVEYRRDGTTVAVSGENITIFKYKAVAFRKGYFLESTTLADNGKPNCQGLSSKFVEKHTLSRTYIEVSQSRMNVFVVDSYDQPLLTFERDTAQKSRNK